MITFDCPHCGAAMKAPDEAAGKNGRCKKCGEMAEVPEQTEAEEPDKVYVPAPSSDSAAGLGTRGCLMLGLRLFPWACFWLWLLLLDSNYSAAMRRTQSAVQESAVSNHYCFLILFWFSVVYGADRIAAAFSRSRP